MRSSTVRALSIPRQQRRTRVSNRCRRTSGHRRWRRRRDRRGPCLDEGRAREREAAGASGKRSEETSQPGSAVAVGRREPREHRVRLDQDVGGHARPASQASALACALRASWQSPPRPHSYRPRSPARTFDRRANQFVGQRGRLPTRVRLPGLPRSVPGTSASAPARSRYGRPARESRRSPRDRGRGASGVAWE